MVVVPAAAGRVDGWVGGWTAVVGQPGAHRQAGVGVWIGVAGQPGVHRQGRRLGRGRTTASGCALPLGGPPARLRPLPGPSALPPLWPPLPKGGQRQPGAVGGQITRLVGPLAVHVAGGVDQPRHVPHLRRRGGWRPRGARPLGRERRLGGLGRHGSALALQTLSIGLPRAILPASGPPAPSMHTSTSRAAAALTRTWRTQPPHRTAGQPPNHHSGRYCAAGGRR